MKIDVRDLRVAYGMGRKKLLVVDDVSFTVEDGTVMGLVGESGCGKTTLARALVGLAPIAGGSIELGGRDVTVSRAGRYLRDNIQLVFQDPYSSLDPRMTVNTLITEAVCIHKRSARSEASREVGRLLELVGLRPEMDRRYPHEMSGGQLQRVAIARALATGCQVIVADEFTSALDVSVQAALLNTLRELQRELSLTCLLISHDLSVVRYMCDTIGVMYLGKLVELGSTARVFDEPQHPYTLALLESIPSLKNVDRRQAPLAGEIPDPARPPEGCRFNPRCPIGPVHRPERTVCRSTSPELRVTNGHPVACHFPLDIGRDRERLLADG